ncbi:MAG: hypothetical protein NXY57DRAFT_1043950 [Lentinula lateritia]|nr:MAG: hypothetical protein NXY57DRAFT_1043950 [Lentinula lateritia]
MLNERNILLKFTYSQEHLLKSSHLQFVPHRFENSLTGDDLTRPILLLNIPLATSHVNVCVYIWRQRRTVIVFNSGRNPAALVSIIIPSLKSATLRSSVGGTALPRESSLEPLDIANSMTSALPEGLKGDLGDIKDLDEEGNGYGCRGRGRSGYCVKDTREFDEDGDYSNDEEGPNKGNDPSDNEAEQDVNKTNVGHFPVFLFQQKLPPVLNLSPIIQQTNCFPKLCTQCRLANPFKTR